MRISLWLPTFTHGNPDFRALPERARRAESLGFHGIYLLDHLLPIAGVHASAWLDTVVGLSMLATATERVTIGTASLVAGFRHPVLLAKQLASVAAISGPRLVLGASAGWFAPEYEVFGYRVEDRAGRTDETLEATRLLLARDHVSFEGRYWRFDDITIAPRPEEPVPFLIGGGSRTLAAGSDRDRPVMTPTVLGRIVRWDGWLAPCAGREELTYTDLEQVRRARIDASTGNPPGERGFVLAHVQWVHLVDTDDREAALQEQLPAFRAMMGSHHSELHFIDTYLLGSVGDILSRIGRLRDQGFEEIILGPVVHDEEQLELIARLLLPFVSTNVEIAPRVKWRP